MGFEPTTLRDLVRCSNHWATGDSMASKGELWVFDWNCIAQSVRWLINIYFALFCLMLGSPILESGKIYLWIPESWVLKSRHQLQKSSFLLRIRIQNPVIYVKWSGIHGGESRIQDNLGLPFMVRHSMSISVIVHFYYPKLILLLFVCSHPL